jgi:PleD family two-component response regulator
MVPKGAGRDRLSVTCSIGLASFREAPATVELMLAAADRLMYAAKAAGGNAVRQGVCDAQECLSSQGRVLPFPALPKA